MIQKDNYPTFGNFGSCTFAASSIGASLRIQKNVIEIELVPPLDSICPESHLKKLLQSIDLRKVGNKTDEFNTLAKALITKVPGEHVRYAQFAAFALLAAEKGAVSIVTLRRIWKSSGHRLMDASVGMETNLKLGYLEPKKQGLAIVEKDLLMLTESGRNVLSIDLSKKPGK